MNVSAISRKASPSLMTVVSSAGVPGGFMNEHVSFNDGFIRQLLFSELL
jgi:hypothetical protein